MSTEGRDRDGLDRDGRESLAADASTLEFAWALQKAWSETANQVKKTPRRARAAALVLLVIGAVAGAIGASAASGGAAQVWAVAAAFSLASAGMVETFVVTPDRDQEWTAARMASERLKAAVWRFRTGAPPYDGTTAENDELLSHEVEDIEHEASLNVARRFDPHPVELPTLPEGSIVDLYVAKRADRQRKYHRNASEREKRDGDRLRVAVVVLSAGGALLVSLSSIPALFDDAPLAAWVAALSAATGAVTTHAGAARHHDIARAFANTANRLDVITRRFNQASDRDAAFPDYVESVERVLAIQNDTWTDTIER